MDPFEGSPEDRRFEDSRDADIHQSLGMDWLARHEPLARLKRVDRKSSEFQKKMIRSESVLRM